VSVFPFIEAEKAGQQGTVARSCELLEVSRSAFYEWHQHTPSARQPGYFIRRLVMVVRGRGVVASVCGVPMAASLGVVGARS
jgi:hypothetical protein